MAFHAQNLFTWGSIQMCTFLGLQSEMVGSGKDYTSCYSSMFEVMVLVGLAFRLPGFTHGCQLAQLLCFEHQLELQALAADHVVVIIYSICTPPSPETGLGCLTLVGT
ncbi:UNVERIFIED_CONTAM: hypothetical protein K2H54_061394 [Gekko kuhli]